MNTSKRIAALRAYMSEIGLDMCVLTQPENMQYFSGFEAITYSRPIVFLITADSTDLIVPALEEAHAHLDSTCVEHLHVYYEHPEKMTIASSYMDIIKKLLTEYKISTLGAEFSAMSIQTAHKLEHLGCKLVDISAKLIKMRAIKEEQEKKFIREAGKLCCFAFEKSLEHACIGITEMEFEQYGTQALYEFVSQDYPYKFSSPGCITPSGIKRTVLPHVFSGTRKFQSGDMVIHVRKPSVNGYYGELERTFFVGNPKPRAVRAFSAMLEAQTAVISAIKPGVTAKEMDTLGRNVLRKYGYEEYAIHRIGHGQGLGRHEPPFLICNNDLVLEEGMVFTVEPGIYIPDVGGFRHSDTLIITKTGCENTTDFKRSLEDLSF